MPGRTKVADLVDTRFVSWILCDRCVGFLQNETSPTPSLSIRDVSVKRCSNTTYLPLLTLTRRQQSTLPENTYYGEKEVIPEVCLKLSFGFRRVFPVYLAHSRLYSPQMLMLEGDMMACPVLSHAQASPSRVVLFVHSTSRESRSTCRSVVLLPPGYFLGSPSIPEFCFS